MDITEDYKYQISEIAKFVGKSVADLKIIEEDDNEVICDMAGTALSTIEKFLSWDGESDEKILVNPVQYSKIIFEDDNQNAFEKKLNKGDQIFNHRSTFEGAFFVEENGYFIVKHCPKDPSYINEKLHWSDICGTYDEIVKFVEEENFFKKI